MWYTSGKASKAAINMITSSSYPRDQLLIHTYKLPKRVKKTKQKKKLFHMTILGN